MKFNQIINKLNSVTTGFRNGNSQMAASFTPNGRHVICASEDSQVYVWKYEEPRQGGNNNGKSRQLAVTRAYESFLCKDVAVAVPWPFTIKGDPPQAPPRNAKKSSKRSSNSQLPSSCDSLPRSEDAANNSKRSALPPLPNKKHEDPSATESNTTGGDSPAKPPLPKKNNNNNNSNNNVNNNNGYNNSVAESRTDSPDCSSASQAEEVGEPEAISRTESGIGDSFGSDSSSTRYDDASAISAPSNTTASSSWSSSWSWFDNGQGAVTGHPVAWGLVIATASLGGEIRCYQNFGLPRKIGGGLF